LFFVYCFLSKFFAIAFFQNFSTVLPHPAKGKEDSSIEFLPVCNHVFFKVQPAQKNHTTHSSAGAARAGEPCF
jgi:hypothetical protein